MLRPAIPEDFPLLYETLYHAIFVPPGQAPFDRALLELPELARYVVDFGRRAGDMGILAWDGENYCGAAWVRLMQGYGFVNAETPELTIAVLPPYRGQGLGTTLLHALFQQVHPPYSAISLSVQRENPAYLLYLRLGFQVWSAEGDSVTMLKQF